MKKNSDFAKLVPLNMDIRENFERPSPKKKQEKRSFISIYWKCCNRFSRVYKDGTGSFYKGACPSCRSELKVPIGNDGTQQRTFIAE